MEQSRKSALPDNFDEISEERSKSEYRIEAAYEKLGCTAEDVATVPKISHILKKIKGGVREAIEFLRHSTADEARQFFKTYEDLPKYLADTLPIEAFCFAAGVDTRTICKLIFDQALEQSNQAARMLTAVNLEDLVQASIDVGKQPLGQKDRENLQKAAGFLPIPDGMKINILNQNSANATSSAQAAAVATLPPAESTIRRMSDRFTERFIGTAQPAALPEVQEQVDFIPSSNLEPAYIEREEESDED